MDAVQFPAPAAQVPQPPVQVPPQAAVQGPPQAAVQGPPQAAAQAPNVQAQAAAVVPHADGGNLEVNVRLYSFSVKIALILYPWSSVT